MASKTFDIKLLLKDAGAVTADAAGTVAAAAKVLDLGDAAYVGDGVQAVIDVSALDTSSGDETYDVMIQGATDAAFTTPVALAKRTIKNTGRHDLPFSNAMPDGTYLRYLRTFIDVAGTTPSINCTVWVGKQ